MEQFINQKVLIATCLGGMNGAAAGYTGVVTSVDDEFICLDNEKYIAKKFVLSITLE